MTNDAAPLSDVDLEQLALQKMSPVLGAGQARALMTRLLAELQIELKTPQDLYTFAQAMVRMNGFEGAVGAVLSVAAVMRGARPAAKTSSAPRP